MVIRKARAEVGTAIERVFRMLACVSVFIVVPALSACARSSNSTVLTSPSAVPATASPSLALATTSPSSVPVSASPAPSDTDGGANLLTFSAGTFVRNWTPGASPSGPEELPQNSRYDVDPKFAGTPELVFEIPAIAELSRISVEANISGAPTVRIHVAAATTDRNTFSDVGTIGLATGTESSGSLPGPIAARWLRVRIERPAGDAVSISSIKATGKVMIPAASFTGLWSPSETLYASDAIFDNVKGNVPEGGVQTAPSQLATLEHNGSLIVATCSYERDVYRGPIVNGTAQLGNGGSLSVVANGSLLVGYARDEEPILARRVVRAPTCGPSAVGRGPKVAILARYPNRVAGYGDPTVVSGFRYETSLLPLFTAANLQSARVAVLSMSCSADKDTEPWQQKALLDFVASGRVLVVRDADLCSKSDYSFIPYPFTTIASGAGGAAGHVLAIVDSSTLADANRTDARHFVDTAAYLKNPGQQVGDADVMQTEDPHWCGLMFAKNAVGASGWVRAYARYGKGLIVYDGFDADDLYGKIPQAITLTRSAYEISPSADLPCGARVSAPLVVLSSVQRTVAFGSARDITLAFLVVRQGSGAAGPVTMAIDGERGAGWRATSDRHDFTVGKQGQTVHVTVHVPANATPTRHMYSLIATDQGGQNAAAAIVLDVSEPLAKELEQSGRARIYGIHFDVASDRIQPQSKPIIREIGLVLQSHPDWRMSVDGYTDSDGGPAYNLTLSRRRSQAVVNDLVAHYHIAATRLRARGFGLTQPVASNATDAGKALNRRVELVKL